jgi:hypothetical protein
MKFRRNEMAKESFIAPKFRKNEIVVSPKRNGSGSLILPTFLANLLQT